MTSQFVSSLAIREFPKWWIPGTAELQFYHRIFGSSSWTIFTMVMVQFPMLKCLICRCLSISISEKRTTPWIGSYFLQNPLVLMDLNPQIHPFFGSWHAHPSLKLLIISYCTYYISMIASWHPPSDSSDPRSISSIIIILSSYVLRKTTLWASGIPLPSPPYRPGLPPPGWEERQLHGGAGHPASRPQRESCHRKERPAHHAARGQRGAWRWRWDELGLSIDVNCYMIVTWFKTIYIT